MKEASSTQPRPEDTKRYGARRAVAGLALSVMGVAGVGAAHNALQSPGDSQPVETVSYVVEPGDTGIGIGNKLGEGEAVREIASQVQDQADEHGLLQPGQHVAVNAELANDPHAGQYIESDK